MRKISQEPAFPTHGGNHESDDPRNHTLGGGMFLRDYFAAKAMQEIIVLYSKEFYRSHAEIASESYTMADAMMKERTK